MTLFIGQPRQFTRKRKNRIFVACLNRLAHLLKISAALSRNLQRLFYDLALHLTPRFCLPVRIDPSFVSVANSVLPLARVRAIAPDLSSAPQAPTFPRRQIIKNSETFFS
jgi:hypothetical protein